jgi:hypothetical protein
MALKKNDRKLLTAIAEYGVLTVKQLSALTDRSGQVLRGRVRDWEREGYIITKPQGYGRGRGRPEDVIFLDGKASALLAEEGIPTAHGSRERPGDSFCLDHRLLTNWFRIHLLQIEKVIPQVSVKYLSPNSLPFPENIKESWLPEHIPNDKPGKAVEFIPDGIFSITNSEAEQKTLLFFLEVDMGTETIASTDRGPKDVRQKILNYQTLFRRGLYKEYEPMFDAKLNGFRLLFLANSARRSIKLCRLVREMRPSDFIWLADQEKMFSQGLAAKIWTRGGRDDSPPESIMGRLFRNTPVTNVEE